MTEVLAYMLCSAGKRKQEMPSLPFMNSNIFYEAYLQGMIVVLNIIIMPTRCLFD